MWEYSLLFVQNTSLDQTCKKTSDGSPKNSTRYKKIHLCADRSSRAPPCLSASGPRPTGLLHMILDRSPDREALREPLESIKRCLVIVERRDLSRRTGKIGNEPKGTRLGINRVRLEVSIRYAQGQPFLSPAPEDERNTHEIRTDSLR
jgi:hypothetical protein